MLTADENKSVYLVDKRYAEPEFRRHFSKFMEERISGDYKCKQHGSEKQGDLSLNEDSRYKPS